MCTEQSIPVAGKGKIISSKQIQESVYLVETELNEEFQNLPNPGQFYMLKTVPSDVYLSRPISVYRSYKTATGSVRVEFLILKKGRGTEELCTARSETAIKIIGPLGNGFTKQDSCERKTALVGGGIGVAPVAGFARSLADGSYDFYACFKHGSYGLDYIKPESVFISTDDGSCGVKGMLPSIFSEKDAAEYAAVYACGPEPMLKYVQKTCKTAGVPCFLSLEARMACGLGACLGCTVKTTAGNKRCCKDGPVFSGDEIVFGERK